MPLFGVNEVVVIVPDASDVDVHTPPLVVKRVYVRAFVLIPEPASVKSVFVIDHGVLVVLLLVEFVVKPAMVNAPPEGLVMSLTKVSNLSLELPAASVAFTVIVGVDVVPDDQVTEFEVNGDVESALLVKLNPVEVPASDGNVTVTPPDPASVTAEVMVKERLEPLPL